MKKFLAAKLLVILVGMAVLPWACSSSSSPTSPNAGNTPVSPSSYTATPTPSSTNTGIPTASTTPTSTSTGSPVSPSSYTATPTGSATPTNTVVSTSTSTATPTRTSTSTATLTATSTPTITPTLTATSSPTATSVIEWYDAYIEQDDNFGYSFLAYVGLRVNGVPETTAAVTVKGPGSTLTQMVYSNTVNLGGNNYAQYLNLASSGTYQPGQTYILSTLTSAGLASVTLMAPGGFTVSPDGLTASWNVAGSYANEVLVYNSVGTYLYGSNSNVASPFQIPATVYSAPGTYVVKPICASTGIASNAGIVNPPHAGDYGAVTVVNCFTNGTPCTSSPTSTPTATNTPNLTPSNTFTPTFTFTATKTPTFTGTPTFTPTLTNTLTNTSTPTPTNTATRTPSPTPTSGIYWYLGDVHRDQTTSGMVSQSAFVYLQVNGSPDSGVTVLLTGSNIGAPVTLPYAGTISTSNGVCANYSQNSGWTYQEGQTYALTTITSAGTASATLTAPGKVTHVRAAAAPGGGVTLSSWLVEGNNDLVRILNMNTTATTFDSGSDVDSPVTINPATAYPASGGVTYNVFTYTENRTSSIPNTQVPSYFSVDDNIVDQVIK